MLLLLLLMHIVHFVLDHGLNNFHQLLRHLTHQIINPHVNLLVNEGGSHERGLTLVNHLIRS